ncbi:Bud-site selection protein [Russula earlei]|uniref:Bud-site selection protein n=1 Tax=Russula earlei TaxID=71964 RepID=A0ACC0UNI5_9AGAM|nr:Bud-site selection protein [Russula earlei]
MPITDSRGTKRKHPFMSTDGDSVKLTGKLFHGLKEVKKAAKKAKAFETQKIVKRLKATRVPLVGKSSDKSVLEAELNALKAIDHDRIGTLALKSKLKKDKLLSSDPSMQSAVLKTFASDIVPTSEGVTAKMESRLLSSKILSKEVKMVILSLHSTLEPSGDSGDGVDEASTYTHDPHTIHPLVMANPPSAQQVAEDTAGDSDDDASNSSDSTRSDSSFQPSTFTRFPKSPATSDRANHSPLLSDDVSQTLGTGSVFLPTLSNGFIPGGSDTDWSDAEAKAVDPVRKNRRGQRARRAIWEKKYGKGAKHLQKREESSIARTPRKHFKEQKANLRPQLSVPSKRNSRAEKADHVSEKHISHQRKSRAVDDRPLHPSWVAKMRMKESASEAIVPSQGKRIKFDD